MARSYTTRTILNGGQAKDEDFNTEIQVPLGEFNGQLDQNQLPLQSVNFNHIAQPTTSISYISQNGTYSTYMQTQSYHQSEYTKTINLDVPYMQWDNTLYAGQGWISLQAWQLQTHSHLQTGGAEITFNANEGMIAGNAVIDFTLFPGTSQNQAVVPTQGGDIGLKIKNIYAYNKTVEWAVFIDDVCVSKSGVIYPRRLTLNLPFNSPVSTKPVNIDIRFRIQFMDPAELDGGATTINSTIDVLQYLKYNGGVLWTRQQFR
tara:strand:+ start:825 stop:1607 length:783 start_codon:yes stop_codon:yes gene_type:complete